MYTLFQRASRSPEIVDLLKRLSATPRKYVESCLQHWMSRSKPIKFSPWVAALFHARARNFDNVCVGENHPMGYGCTSAFCRFPHICLLCGRAGHGVFMLDEATNAYICEKYQRLRDALALTGLGLHEVEDLGFWVRDFGVPQPVNIGDRQEFPALPASPVPARAWALPAASPATPTQPGGSGDASPTRPAARTATSELTTVGRPPGGASVSVADPPTDAANSKGAWLVRAHVLTSYSRAYG